MAHHTKDKGDLGVLKAQLEFHQMGYVICYPATEHAPFDLVIYKDKQCKTVQVKYRKLVNGCVPIPLKTSWADKNGNHSSSYDKEQIDIMCVYCPDTDLCYFVDINKFHNTTEITLRVKPPKGPCGKYHKAEDYRLIP